MTALDQEDTQDEKQPRGYPGPRKDKGAMDLEDLAAILRSYQDDSISYVDSVLSPTRAVAHQYYKGAPFGNEEPGRSQVVMTDVADSVSAMMPDLMRIFTGPKHYVEFDPTRSDAIPQAEQKTDYVRYVFERDNPGFQIVYDTLWDGLVKALGVIKWGWEDHCVKHYSLRHVTQDEIDALRADEDSTISMIEKEDDKITVYPTPDDQAAWQEGAIAAQQAGQQPPPQPQPHEEDAFSLEVAVQIPTGRCRVWSVPPEELLVLRQGRDPQYGTMFMAHRMKKTRGELLDLGLTEDEIDEHGGSYSTLDTNPEEVERQPDETAVTETAAPGDENYKHDYMENYVIVDFNGDGYSELRMIATLGPEPWIIPSKNKVISARPFGIFSPYPEPHSLIGRSVADRTMDLQKINSSLVRSGLDSLSASIFPRTAYQDGQVSVADLQNTEIGAGIRCKGRPADVMQPYAHTFNGDKIFPFLEFMKQTKEERTGVVKGAAGLDMDALQSTTPDAAAAAIASNKMQVELIARIYVETCLKPCFKGIAQLLSENQPTERIVKLRGKFVPINPRAWDDDLDCTVNVALGNSDDKKLATLIGIKQDQDALMAAYGPGNPAITVGQALHTRHEIMKAQGITDSENYYVVKPVDFNPPPPPPQKSEAQIIAEGEQAVKKIEVMGKLAIAQEEIKLKQQIEQNHFQIEMAKIEASKNPDSKLAEIDARRSEKLAEIDARVEQASAEIAHKSTLTREQMDLELQIAREKNATDIQIADSKNAADVQVKKHAAETAAQAKVDSKPDPAPAPEPKPAPAPKLPDVHIHLPSGKKTVTKTGDSSYEVTEG